MLFIFIFCKQTIKKRSSFPVKPDLSINHHSIINRQGTLKSVQENPPIFFYETNRKDGSTSDDKSPRVGSEETQKLGDSRPGEYSYGDEQGPNHQFVFRNSRQTQANKPMPSSGCKLTALVRGGSVQWAKICSDSESQDEFGEDHGYIEAVEMK